MITQATDPSIDTFRHVDKHAFLTAFALREVRESACICDAIRRLAAVSRWAVGTGDFYCDQVADAMRPAMQQLLRDGVR